MFKKKCRSCENKVSKKFDFCPYCGEQLKEIYKEDYGILGNSDTLNKEDLFSSNNPLIDQLLGRALKEIPSLIKQMEKDMANTNNNLDNFNQRPPAFPPGMKIKFAINGKEIDLSGMQNQGQQEKPIRKVIQKISEEKAKKFAALPRKEAKSNMKRFANKIVYELQTPGVKDLGDIIINQLESCIEIKALSTENVYTKTLNISLPIVKYSLVKDNLILEFQAK